MTFSFTVKIDHKALNQMMDAFLKTHEKELSSMVGKCLTIVSNEDLVSTPSQVEQKTIPDKVVEVMKDPDAQIDGRPIIGSIPDDPFSNLFPNPNANITRSGDRK